MGIELIGSKLVELRKSSTYYSKNRRVTDEIVIWLRNEFTCTANPYQTFGSGERNVIAQLDKIVPTGSKLVDVQISPHSSAPNELQVALIPGIRRPFSERDLLQDRYI